MNKPGRQSSSALSTSTEQQLLLAKSAAAGDKKSRQAINQIAEPLIHFHTGRFCKRFCNENQYLYRCTLKPPIGSLRHDVNWCEWGNASYGWMLNDLSNEKRLLKYQARNGARLFDYFYQIANSLPFYERWKDWRFARKIHVPEYIKTLSPDAIRVFLALRAGDTIELIAQKLQRPLQDIQTLVQSIIIILTQKKRLHLLNPPSHLSLSDGEDESSSPANSPELAVFDEAIDVLEDKTLLQNAWCRLNPAEQFVLEALIIEDQQAEDVLSALRKLNISIKEGVLPEQTNRQQLYYFRRKTLQRLSEYMQQEIS